MIGFLHHLPFNLVAQLAEHHTFNVGVLGSSPSGVTNQIIINMSILIAITLAFIIFQLVWQSTVKKDLQRRLEELPEEKVNWEYFKRVSRVFDTPIWITLVFLVCLIVGSFF
jgi:hypothetical protein